MNIQAAIIEKAGQDFRIVDMELDPPKRDEVLVKVAACGVCHTDEVARNQDAPVPMPIVLGHEGCGVIEAVGPGVTDFAPGDRVLFSFSYCGECEACRTGHPYACSENVRLNFFGAQFDNTLRRRYGGKQIASFFGQGAFATHAVVHRNNLVRAPEDVPLELMAPLGCGIQTGAGAVLNKLRPEPGSSILISGCGAVGLSAVMAAKLAGCSTIIAVDVVPARLELALELGATHTIHAREQNVVEACQAITGPGVHYAIDATGIGECVRTSLNCTRIMGTCAVVGATKEMTINVERELMGVCKTLTSVVEGCCIPQLFIPKLLDFYRSGRFPFDRLIRRYPFAEINQAFEDTKKGRAIKAVLVMDA